VTVESVGSEGDSLVIFGEGIGVQSTIMHYPSIKDPRPSQEDMTSIHRDYITANIIFVVLPKDKETKQ